MAGSRRRLVGRLVMATALAAPALSATLPATPVAAAGDPAPIEARFLQLANGERGAAKLRPLVSDAAMISMARAHSQRMASQGRIFHNPGKSALLDRCLLVGENVGRGGSAEIVHQAFMASPTHRSEILGPFDRVGVGVAIGGPNVYVTEVFCQSDGAVPAAASAPVATPAAKPAAKPAPKPAAKKTSTTVKAAPAPVPPAPPPPPPPPLPPPPTTGMGTPTRFL